MATIPSAIHAFCTHQHPPALPVLACVRFTWLALRQRPDLSLAQAVTQIVTEVGLNLTAGLSDERKSALHSAWTCLQEERATHWPRLKDFFSYIFESLGRFYTLHKELRGALHGADDHDSFCCQLHRRHHRECLGLYDVLLDEKLLQTHPQWFWRWVVSDHKDLVALPSLDLHDQLGCALHLPPRALAERHRVVGSTSDRLSHFFFRLFPQLIAHHLDAGAKAALSRPPALVCESFAARRQLLQVVLPPVELCDLVAAYAGPATNQETLVIHAPDALECMFDADTETLMMRLEDRWGERKVPWWECVLGRDVAPKPQRRQQCSDAWRPFLRLFDDETLEEIPEGEIRYDKTDWVYPADGVYCDVEVYYEQRPQHQPPAIKLVEVINKPAECGGEIEFHLIQMGHRSEQEERLLCILPREERSWPTLLFVGPDYAVVGAVNRACQWGQVYWFTRVQLDVLRDVETASVAESLEATFQNKRICCR